MTVDQLRAEAMSLRPQIIDSTLFAWYPFVGTTEAAMLLDYSGNGIDLTNNGSAPAVIDGPYVTWGSHHVLRIQPSNAAYSLAGITKDADGVALGSCDVFLCKDNGDNTASFVDYQVSHVTTGAYSFAAISDNDAAYFCIAYKSGSPVRMDATDHVLQPVL